MSLTPSRLARWGRVALGLLAAGVLFGPSLGAFATSRIEVPSPTRPPILVIAARPFSALAAAPRAGAAPLRVGPTERTKGLARDSVLRARMNEAATRCAVQSSNYLVLSVSVSGEGRITDVGADAGGDRRLAVCATAYLRQRQEVLAHGPGTLKIGYFVPRGRGSPPFRAEL